MLKLHVPKVCSNLFARLKDIAEKQIPAKLKPIVGYNISMINNQWYDITLVLRRVFNLQTGVSKKKLMPSTYNTPASIHT